VLETINLEMMNEWDDDDDWQDERVGGDNFVSV
jgi:hypothetical protein